MDNKLHIIVKYRKWNQLEFGLYEGHVWLINASEHTRSWNEQEDHIHERQMDFVVSLELVSVLWAANKPLSMIITFEIIAAKFGGRAGVKWLSKGQIIFFTFSGLAIGWKTVSL